MANTFLIPKKFVAALRARNFGPEPRAWTWRATGAAAGRALAKYFQCLVLVFLVEPARVNQVVRAYVAHLPCRAALKLHQVLSSIDLRHTFQRKVVTPLQPPEVHVATVVRGVGNSFERTHHAGYVSSWAAH